MLAIKIKGSRWTGQRMAPNGAENQQQGPGRPAHGTSRCRKINSSRCAKAKNQRQPQRQGQKQIKYAAVAGLLQQRNARRGRVGVEGWAGFLPAGACSSIFSRLAREANEKLRKAQWWRIKAKVGARHGVQPLQGRAMLAHCQKLDLRYFLADATVVRC